MPRVERTSEAHTKHNMRHRTLHAGCPSRSVYTMQREADPVFPRAARWLAALQIVHHATGGGP
eukprot:4743755-Prymnesium_polylepis.1